jgi:hypothetical protein
MKLRAIFLSSLLAASCGAERPNASAQEAAGADAPLAAAVPAAAAQGAPWSSPQRALPPGVFEMARAEIVDRNGFERPIVAATVLIPKGWTLEGGVQWNPAGACGSDYATNVEIRSPDGAMRLRTFPAASWSAFQSAMPINQPQQQGCENASYRSVREYILASVSRNLPGARVLDYRDLADEARPMRELIAQYPPLQSDTMRTRMIYEGGEALVAYQENGRDMRAAVSALALIAETEVMDMLNPGQIGFASVNGFPVSLTVVSAPAGSLDLGLRQRIARSMLFHPDWMARIRKYEAEKARIAAKGAADRHAIAMDAIKQRGEIISGMYEASSLSSDRMHRETIESIRGVETYDDPVSGSTVQLDNTYDYAYRVNGSDSYLLTNDVNFNPGAYGLDAQPLTPTK